MISYVWFRTKFFTNSNSLTEHYVFLINEFRNTRPYHSINLNFLCIVEYWFPISQFSFFLCIQMHACEEIWLHLSVWDWVCKRFGLIIDKTVFVLIKGMFSDVAQIHYVRKTAWYFLTIRKCLNLSQQTKFYHSVRNLNTVKLLCNTK